MDAEAAAALREAVKRTLISHKILHERMAETLPLIAEIEQPGSLDDVMVRSNAFAMAIDYIARLSESLKKEVDTALLNSMLDTGCPHFKAGMLTVGYRENPAIIDIPDPSLVPAEYTIPKPDLTMIRAVLKKGHTLNWATLRDPTMSIVRRSNTR